MDLVQVAGGEAQPSTLYWVARSVQVEGWQVRQSPPEGLDTALRGLHDRSVYRVHPGQDLAAEAEQVRAAAVALWKTATAKNPMWLTIKRKVISSCSLFQVWDDQALDRWEFLMEKGYLLFVLSTGGIFFALPMCLGLSWFDLQYGHKFVEGPHQVGAEDFLWSLAISTICGWAFAHIGWTATLSSYKSHLKLRNSKRQPIDPAP
ncbi:MAG: hypothetical protein ACI883_000532 [Candidatus Azotimanducaceae bacterium]|jgi:hypothetical protein|tara:strand:+ start:11980 stop:12594 length:615 start_codon:yes stop_codon:yes gene_type:complete